MGNSPFILDNNPPVSCSGACVPGRSDMMLDTCYNGKIMREGPGMPGLINRMLETQR